MASPLYTQVFGSWQNVPSGKAVSMQMATTGGPVTYVIRFVSIYFGSPSPIVSNSVVLIDQNAILGFPTVWSFDSGITQSGNPIYHADDVNLCSPSLTVTTGNRALWIFHNTSQSTSSVDIHCSGWILAGEVNVPVVQPSTAPF